jgi:hypothetical protein
VSKTSSTTAQSTARISVEDSVANQDVDDTQSSMMTADMSMASTASKTKKPGRPKKATTKTTRSKAATVTQLMESGEVVDPVSLPPTRATRGKKRTSDEMLQDSIDIIEPPKKRATRNRSSTVKPESREPSPIQTDVTMEDAEVSDPVSKKEAKGGRKRASSTTRKPSERIMSNQSTASQASLRASNPADDEIDAQLAADLERYESDDDESDNWKVLGTDDSIVSQVYNASTRISNASNRVAATRTTIRGRATSSIIDPAPGVIFEDSVVEVVQPDPEVAIVKKPKAKVNKKGKKAGSILEPEIHEPNALDLDLEEFERSLEADEQEQFNSATATAAQENVLDSRSSTSPPRATRPTGSTAADDSGHETDGSLLVQTKAKKTFQKGKGAVKAKQPASKIATNSKATTKKNKDSVLQARTTVNEDKVDDSLEEQGISMNQAERQRLSRQMPSRVSPTIDVALDLVEAPTPRGPVSIIEQTMSPEASPQSSDAENQPPSSRPSQTRPPLARYSPTGTRTVRVALAPSTPTASPSKRNACLETSYPWAPADIDYILMGTPAANRENIDLKNLLGAEEKKMTLEEWITWNAKKNEDRLKAECERMVGKFESEGVRALKTLEGIVCSD